MAETIGTLSVVIHGAGGSKIGRFILGLVARLFGIKLTVESTLPKKAEKMYCVSDSWQRAIEFARERNVSVQNVIIVENVVQVMGMGKHSIYFLPGFSSVEKHQGIARRCRIEGWEIIYV